MHDIDAAQLWEIAEPVLHYPMGPHEAREVLEAAGQMFAEGFTVGHMCDAIRRLKAERDGVAPAALLEGDGGE